MHGETEIYRQLQRHLNAQAVGFPSAVSGADLRLLERLFAPEEAQVALCLSYKPEAIGRIVERTAREFSAEHTARLLESMFSKGAIGWKEKEGAPHWFLMPLVLGMYEAQDGEPTPEFLADAKAYMQTIGWGRAFLVAHPPQMRTIPVDVSISVDHPVATYDQVRGIVEGSRGPFVVLKCICRQASAMNGARCKKTSRLETCLGFGDVAAMVLRRGHGRETSRQEVREILRQNQDDGLVLQPSNARNPEFVCSCCGCCCGMLAFQKLLPRPIDFWTSNFSAEVSSEACKSCGKCVSRCQVGAIALSGSSGKAEVNLGRCIGCGLCVPTCPSDAIRLASKDSQTVPPENEEALYDRIKENKKKAGERLRLAMKGALGIDR
jgi:ferredoxin